MSNYTLVDARSPLPWLCNLSTSQGNADPCVTGIPTTGFSGPGRLLTNVGGELGRPLWAGLRFASDCRRCRLELRILMIYIRGRLVESRRFAGLRWIQKKRDARPACQKPGATIASAGRRENLSTIQVEHTLEFPLLAFAPLLPAVVVASDIRGSLN